jgi:hypothetical protein
MVKVELALVIFSISPSPEIDPENVWLEEDE